MADSVLRAGVDMASREVEHALISLAEVNYERVRDTTKRGLDAANGLRDHLPADGEHAETFAARLDTAIAALTSAHDHPYDKPRHREDLAEHLVRALKALAGLSELVIL